MKRFGLLLLFIIASYPRAAFCQSPEISSVTGNVNDGEEITITGSGFGANGPNIVLFDDFSGGTHGELIPLDSPDIGQWTSTNGDGVTTGPRYYDDGTGNICFWSFQPTTYAFQLDFPQSGSIYTSYQMMIPDGYSWPGCETPGQLDYYGHFSTYKGPWFQEYQGGYAAAGSDRVIFATVGDATTLFGNNAPNHIYVSKMTGSAEDRFWSWFNWNRASCAMVTGDTLQAPTGDLFFQGISEEWGSRIVTRDGTFQVHADDNPPDNPANPWFSYVGFPGWGWSACTDDPENVDCEVRILYDDFYLATGEHCRARVEIGNSAVYENCSNMAISTVDSWSDTEITATVRMGQLRAGDKFIFVVTSDGVISSGYPVTLPGPPGAPTELRMPEVEH